MSLKAFHIFFIAVSVILAFGFGIWSVYFHLTASHMGYLILGISSFVVGGGLVVYGVRMMQKLRRI